MKQNIIKYETGATSHAVNELILFTDNTRELAEKRDEIYNHIYFMGWAALPMHFIPLLDASQLAYYREFSHSPENHSHVSNMTDNENFEYCELYANDFENWKSEHRYK